MAQFVTNMQNRIHLSLFVAIAISFGGCKSITKTIAPPVTPQPWLESESEARVFNSRLIQSFDKWRTKFRHSKVKIAGPETIWVNEDNLIQTNVWEIIHPPDAEVVAGHEATVSAIGEHAFLSSVHISNTNVGLLDEIVIRVVQPSNGTNDSVLPNGSTNAIKYDHGSSTTNITAEFPITVKRGNRPESWEKGTFTAKFQIEDDINAEKHFGTSFSQSFYCVKVFLKNTYRKPVVFDAASIELPIFYISRLDGATLTNNLSASRDIFYVNYEEDQYRVRSSVRTPMNFTAILNTFEFDQRHNPNNKFVEILREAGVIAGGAAVFISGVDYGKVTSFILGPVTETLAKLLLKDLIEHLGFMNENALHETHRLEAMGTAEKYVFFPKGDIYGIWGMDVPVRTMSIYTEGKAQLDGTVISEMQPTVEE